MSQRLDYPTVAPDALKPLYGLQKYIENGKIDSKLRTLIELRVSQINGCAFCIDLHATQARADGESQQRLDCLAVWREVPFFTEQEQAAFAWAEAVTLITQAGVPDDVYETACRQFTDEELVDLNMIVVTINAWNRFGVSFKRVPSKRKG